jgi:hypothetical protein
MKKLLLLAVFLLVGCSVFCPPQQFHSGDMVYYRGMPTMVTDVKGICPPLYEVQGFQGSVYVEGYELIKR